MEMQGQHKLWFRPGVGKHDLRQRHVRNATVTPATRRGETAQRIVDESVVQPLPPRRLVRAVGGSRAGGAPSRVEHARDVVLEHRHQPVVVIIPPAAVVRALVDERRHAVVVCLDVLDLLPADERGRRLLQTTDHTFNRNGGRRVTLWCDRLEAADCARLVHVAALGVAWLGCNAHVAPDVEQTERPDERRRRRRIARAERRHPAPRAPRRAADRGSAHRVGTSSAPPLDRHVARARRAAASTWHQGARSAPRRYHIRQLLSLPGPAPGPPRRVMVLDLLRLLALPLLHSAGAADPRPTRGPLCPAPSAGCASPTGTAAARPSQPCGGPWVQVSSARRRRSARMGAVVTAAASMASASATPAGPTSTAP